MEFCNFTFHCWSWVHWYLEKELLWKNTGKANKTLTKNVKPINQRSEAQTDNCDFIGPSV